MSDPIGFLGLTHLGEHLLACPNCHGKLERLPGALRCQKTGRLFAISEGILNMMSPPGHAQRSCFDTMARDLLRLSRDPGFWQAFYMHQTQAVEEKLGEANEKVILDVGCGPNLPYLRPLGSTVVGLDASYESLRRNQYVDIRVWGSAVQLPLPAASVDVIICFYSLHHMIGETIYETETLVAQAFAEFRRVLRRGGDLLVVDVAPWWSVWLAQRLLWNRARRWLGQSLNAFFWRRSVLEAVAADYFPLRIETRTVRIPPLLVFPFACASWSPRLPRLLYPFSMALFHWK